MDTRTATSYPWARVSGPGPMQGLRKPVSDEPRRIPSSTTSTLSREHKYLRRGLPAAPAEESREETLSDLPKPQGAQVTGHSPGQPTLPSHSWCESTFAP